MSHFPLPLPLLLLVAGAAASRCWPASSFPSSVLPPVALGRGATVRVPGAPTLPRCVDAACDLPGADVAWLFHGRCYVVSCQQRAQCRPQRRPGAQSHLTFIQRSTTLLPPVFWEDKDLDLDDEDDEDADVLLDFPQSDGKTDPIDQSELGEGLRLGLLEATPSTQRPLQAAVTPLNASDSSTLPADLSQEMTSLPVSTVITSLPVSTVITSLPVSTVITSLPVANIILTASGNVQTTTDALKATAPPTALSPPPAPPSVISPSPPRVTSSSALDSRPVAHAGGSHTLFLPNSSMRLQGSASNADPETVHYLWTRDIQSPAAGDVLFGSHTSSSLVLVNLVEGSYLFHLRVTDAWGRSASATATVQVLPEPGGGDEVELELQVCVSQLSVSQKDTLLSQISALLHVSASDIQVRRLYGHARLSTVLRFSVRSPSGPVRGQSVVSLLKSQLLDERSDFLLFRALRVNTVECQLRCSGRGQCDPVSRLCLCDPFWTENLLRTFLGDGESNCDWRVLYVILSGFILVLLILSITWTFMCCCRRRKQTRVRSKTRYTILDNVDEQETVELRSRCSLKHRSTEHNSSLMMSESELSDQESSREPLRSRNRTKPGLNQD